MSIVSCHEFVVKTCNHHVRANHRCIFRGIIPSRLMAKYLLTINKFWSSHFADTTVNLLKFYQQISEGNSNGILIESDSCSTIISEREEFEPRSSVCYLGTQLIDRINI